MALRLEVLGATEAQAALGDLRAGLDDMEDLWERVGAVMATTEAEWFASEGEGSWDPLAEPTLKDKERYELPLETMIRSGVLKESLEDPLEAMEVGQGRSTLGTFTRNTMTWGADAMEPPGPGMSPDREYAHYHQGIDPVTGEETVYLTRSGHPLPVRQVIPWPLPIQTQAAIHDAMGDWVDEVVRESGLE